MTAASPIQAPVTDPSVPPTSTAPLAVWCILQLMVIALAAARVPLAARYAEPAEQFAPHLLLCGQAIAASLLFPWLLRNARTTGLVLATAIPFQLGAMFLAGNSIRDIGPAIGYVDGFLVALAIWSPLLRSTSLFQSLGVALASCLTLGGGMLRYLRVEYSGGAGDAVPHAWETVTPLPSTLQALAGQTPVGGWIVIAGLAVVVITIRLTTHRRRVANGVNPNKN